MILKRYDALKSEQDRAINDINAGVKLTADRLRLANEDQESLYNTATVQSRYNAVIDAARTAKVKADFAARDAQADLDYKGAQTDASRAQAGYYGAQSDNLRSNIKRAKELGLDAPTSAVIDSFTASGDKAFELAEKARRRDPERAKVLEAQAQNFYTRAQELLDRASPRPTTPGSTPNAKPPGRVIQYGEDGKPLTPGK